MHFIHLEEQIHLLPGPDGFLGLQAGDQLFVLKQEESKALVAQPFDELDFAVEHRIVLLVRLLAQMDGFRPDAQHDLLVEITSEFRPAIDLCFKSLAVALEKQAAVFFSGPARNQIHRGSADKPGDEQSPGMGVQPVGRIQLLDAALVHHGNPVA